jgi:hypothetical protein
MQNRDKGIQCVALFWPVLYENSNFWPIFHKKKFLANFSTKITIFSRFFFKNHNFSQKKQTFLTKKKHNFSQKNTIFHKKTQFFTKKTKIFEQNLFNFQNFLSLQYCPLLNNFMYLFKKCKKIPRSSYR